MERIEQRIYKGSYYITIQATDAEMLDSGYVSLTRPEGCWLAPEDAYRHARDATDTLDAVASGLQAHF